jgi:biotin carboxylase
LATRVLQLGGGVWMKQSITKIKELGYEVYCVDANPDAPAFQIADGCRAVNISDVAGVGQYADEIGADVVVPLNDLGVLPSIIANQKRGLNVGSPDDVRFYTDKSEMRKRWALAGVAQPRFLVCDNIDGIEEAVNTIGYPCIVKPCSMWGSRGVSKVNQPEDIAFAKTFAAGNSREGTYIVEQCMTGTEVSVEGLFNNGNAHVLAIADKELQQHDNYRVTTQINYTAALDETILSEIKTLVAQAGKAMGFISGALHAECMVTSDGVKMIEMAGRPGGGHIFGVIVEAVSGISMPQAYTEILLGNSTRVEPRFQRGACYKFFNAPTGLFMGVDGIEQARKMHGVLDIGFTMKAGTQVGFMDHGANRPGFIVTQGMNRNDAISAANNAQASLKFSVQ